MELQRTHVGLFGAACIKLLPWISYSSRDDDYYREATERKIHLYSKGAGHGGGGNIVPTSSAGGVSKMSSRASMAGDGIDGGACSTVV